MIDPTFIADWRRMFFPVTLTMAVIGGALAFVFTS
jgi:hypothetical protein